MTQFPGSFGAQYLDDTVQPRQTSGLAITALVCSLIFCCPLTTVLGVLLGAIALVSIGSDPSRRGKGLALAAIILGVIFTVAQVMAGAWFFNAFMKPVMEGPRDALTAGFAGDSAGFKAGFYGQGATASDDAAAAFIDELRDRYGAYISVRFDDRAGQAPGGQRQPEQPFPYAITFQNKTVKATGVMVFHDPATNAMPVKFRSLTIHDPDLGDLTYPPAAAASGSTTAPGSGGAGAPGP